MPVCVAGPYAGPPRALLLACKHDGRTGFAPQLGALLAGPLSAAVSCARGPAPPLLVTAPSRASRVRERGYRHVELIVRRALREGGADAVLLPNGLRARPGRRSQVGLGAEERRRNAALLEVRPGAVRTLRGREVVLVDDIVTTGATADAAVRVLEAAGARVIAVAALCGVERRSGGVRGSGDARGAPEREPPWPALGAPAVPPVGKGGEVSGR